MSSPDQRTWNEREDAEGNIVTDKNIQKQAEEKESERELTEK